MPLRPSKRRTISSRLKAFLSFTDSFTSSLLKSGWKTIVGVWVPTISGMTSASSRAVLTVPVTKSDATVSVTVPSNKTGLGVVYWATEAGSYWASYSNTTTSLGASNCNNGACSGTENFTATRSCSCTPITGTCQQVVSDVYGTCSQVTGSCTRTYGICQSTDQYGSCSSDPVYGFCSFTPGSTTYSYNVNDGGFCLGNATQVSCTFCSGPCGSMGFVCCRETIVTSGSWNYSGCSFEGQQVQVGVSWNYPGCSYTGQPIYIGVSWNYSGCSFNGQQVAIGWNYGGCSFEGQTVNLGWNYSGCSFSGQQIYLGQTTSWNYGGCSFNGQQVTIGQSSTCNNGACSGTENYTATRSCSCPTITNRIIRTIKSVAGTITNVGSFAVSSTPTTITAVTNGNQVTVSASGSSQSYTNNDGTTFKNFGIIKEDGGTEQGTTALSFSVNAS